MGYWCFVLYGTGAGAADSGADSGGVLLVHEMQLQLVLLRVGVSDAHGRGGVIGASLGAAVGSRIGAGAGGFAGAGDCNVFHLLNCFSRVQSSYGPFCLL